MYITLDGLCKSFDKRPVVENLSMGLEQGKILCFLGASGCGKTTTLRMIGGFLKPDAGRIYVDGQDITELPPEARPVATVFQSYALFPNMNARENVAYGLKFKRMRRKAALDMAQEYLGMVGLAEYGDAQIDRLSGGQQQRVALARALVLRPKLLLLDEPLSNLDAALRLRMREELKEIQTRFGATMIFVTHDQEEAMAIADTVAIMEQGRILQSGTPAHVYHHPVNDFAMRFFGACSTLHKDGQTLLLRPEQLCFDPEGSICGTISKRSFLGFYTQYAVTVGSDTLLLRALGDQPYQVGDTVRLRVQACRL